MAHTPPLRIFLVRSVRITPRVGVAGGWDVEPRIGLGSRELPLPDPLLTATTARADRSRAWDMATSIGARSAPVAGVIAARL